jgi:hypothetical protein
MRLRVTAYAARNAAVLWVLVRLIVFLFEGPIVLGSAGSAGLSLAIALVVGFEQRRAREDLFLENLGISPRLAPIAAAVVIAGLELDWSLGWKLGVEP